MLGISELVIIVLLMLGTVLWLWSLAHVITTFPQATSAKIGWAIFIALTHALGACVYLIYLYRMHRTAPPIRS